MKALEINPAIFNLTMNFAVKIVISLILIIAESE